MFKIIFEIILVVCIFYSSTIFWQMIHRHGFMKKTLKDISSLKSLVDAMRKTGEINLPADKISIVGSMYTEDYGRNILFEMSSSHTSINKPRNIALVITLILLAVSSYLGFWFVVVNTFLFLLIGFLPVTESAKDNVFKDLLALIWNLNKYIQKDPEDCKKFLQTLTVLQPMHQAILENK